MNATLSKQFEGFAECCLELARSAETTERRARFIQMAGEYRLASLLTSEELSSGPKGRRLLPAAESPPLSLKHPPRAPQTRPQTRLFARSAAPRHPGFKAQMFDADKQTRDLSNRDQGGNANSSIAAERWLLCQKLAREQEKLPLPHPARFNRMTGAR